MDDVFFWLLVVSTFFAILKIHNFEKFPNIKIITGDKQNFFKFLYAGCYSDVKYLDIDINMKIKHLGDTKLFKKFIKSLWFNENSRCNEPYNSYLNDPNQYYSSELNSEYLSLRINNDNEFQLTAYENERDYISKEQNRLLSKFITTCINNSMSDININDQFENIDKQYHDVNSDKLKIYKDNIIKQKINFEHQNFLDKTHIKIPKNNNNIN